MSHHYRTLNRCIRQINEECDALRSEFQLRTFLKKWAEPWCRIEKYLETRTHSLGSVIPHRMLLVQRFAREARKCAAGWRDVKAILSIEDEVGA